MLRLMQKKRAGETSFRLARDLIVEHMISDFALSYLVGEMLDELIGSSVNAATVAF